MPPFTGDDTGVRPQPDHTVPCMPGVTRRVAHHRRNIGPRLRQQRWQPRGLRRRQRRLGRIVQRQRDEPAIGADHVGRIRRRLHLLDPLAILEHPFRHRDQRPIFARVMRGVDDGLQRVGLTAFVRLEPDEAAARDECLLDPLRRTCVLIPPAFRHRHLLRQQRGVFLHADELAPLHIQEVRELFVLVVVDPATRDRAGAQQDEDAEHDPTANQQPELVNAHPVRVEMSLACRPEQAAQPSEERAHVGAAQPAASVSDGPSEPSYLIRSASRVMPSLRIAASFCALMVFLLRCSLSAISVTL